MQHNQSGSTGSEIVLLDTIYVTDLPPKPTEIGIPWGHPFGSGLYTGQTFNTLNYIPRIPDEAETMTKPRPTKKDEIIKTVDDELNAIKERSESDKQQLPTRVDEQIKMLASKNPHAASASEVQQVTSQIEIIDRLRANLLATHEYFANAGKFFGVAPSSVTGQSFVEKIESIGDIKDSHHSAIELINLKLALGAQTTAERMQNEIQILQERKEAAETRLKALIDPPGSSSPNVLLSQLNDLQQQVHAAVQDQPKFVAKKIIAYASVDGRTPTIEAIRKTAQAIENVWQEYYIPPDPGVSFYTLSKIPLSKQDLDERHEEIFNGGPPTRFLFLTERNFKDETARYLVELRAHVVATQTIAQAKAEQLSQIRSQEAARALEAARIAAELEAHRQQQLIEAAALARQQQQALAEQAAILAQDAARNADFARAKAFLEKPGAMVVSVPSATVPVLVSSVGTFMMAEAAAVRLAVAIAEAISQLAGATIATVASVLPGLAVGLVALLLPSPIAPSERRNALSLPLAAFPNLDQQQLADARHNDNIPMPFALNLKSTESGIQISVVQSSASMPLQARVIDVQPYTVQGRYEAVIEHPSRFITATPMVPPGAQPSSTELPATGETAPSYEGSSLTLIDPKLQGAPALEAIETEVFILRFPEESGIAPIYLAVQKPPVEVLEVGEYSELAGRSIKDGLDIDHIPSRKALEYDLKLKYPLLSPKEIKAILDKGAGIAIPQNIHRQFSETSGGRNTKEKQKLDGTDLRRAVEHNFSALRAALMDEGHTAEMLDEAIKRLHEKNMEKGFYQ